MMTKSQGASSVFNIYDTICLIPLAQSFM